MTNNPGADLERYGTTILALRNRILAGETPSEKDLDNCQQALTALATNPHTNGIDWLVRMCHEAEEILDKFRGPKSTRDMERRARRLGLPAPRSIEEAESLRRAAALS